MNIEQQKFNAIQKKTLIKCNNRIYVHAVYTFLIMSLFFCNGLYVHILVVIVIASVKIPECYIKKK